MAVLEPVSYLTETAITPDGIDKRTKEGKAAWAEFQAQNPGKLHISAAENALCLNVVEALHKSDGHDLIKAAIMENQVEVTLHADVGGVPAKARLDGFAMRTLFDVKTARNAGFRAFQRAAIDYRYHVQAAWYLDFAREVGIAADDFVFVVVETEPPFLATVYVADDQFIAAGRAEYKRDLETYKRCLESGTWPGLPKSQTLTLPSWMEVAK
jgi:exodeoxyribonuclease VIII